MSVAVVTGAVATFPVGGVTWDYLQYALGMERLGFDVWYLEDTGLTPYDNVARTYHDEPANGIAHLRDELARLSPTLARRWHVVDVHGDRHGCGRDELADVLADAEVLLNVSGLCQLRPEYAAVDRTICIETDPGWNHFVALPRTRDRAPGSGVLSWTEHDEFATYATALGRPGCTLPDLGVAWRRTLPPVVVAAWDDGTPPPETGAWTTVLTWDNYDGGFTHEGVTYGSKAAGFAALGPLPGRVPVPVEVAVGGVEPPVERWRADGWSVVDGPSATSTAEGYRTYLRGSRGEVAPAKQVYVATGSGWFSCRTVCYLAAGRPAVVQDTGWSATVAPSAGLHAFDDLDGAVAGIRAVESDPAGAAEAARATARDVFAAERVLADLLEGREP